MTFKKGESGNPGGRSKTSIEFKARAREGAEAGLERAIQLVHHKDGRVAMEAVKFLADRGIGKAKAEEFDLGKVSDEALVAEFRRRAELARARATEAGVASAGGGGGGQPPAPPSGGTEPH